MSSGGEVGTKLSNTILRENETNEEKVVGDAGAPVATQPVAGAGVAGSSTTPSPGGVSNSFTKPTPYKIIVLGESGVGKTCLSYRFCAGRFPLLTEATIGLDFREKIVDLDGSRLKLQIWDTAGQERFRGSVTHHYYRGAHAVVLVYDVCNKTSLERLKDWLDELDLHGLGVGEVPRVLVGNKCDQGTQQVNTALAQRWADDRGMPLFETSAKDDSQSDHVEAIFLTLAHKLKNKKQLIKPVVDPNNPEVEPVRLVYRSTLTAPPPEESGTCCF